MEADGGDSEDENRDTVARAGQGQVVEHASDSGGGDYAAIKEIERAEDARNGAKAEVNFAA